MLLMQFFFCGCRCVSERERERERERETGFILGLDLFTNIS